MSCITRGAALCAFFAVNAGHAASFVDSDLRCSSSCMEIAGRSKEVTSSSAEKLAADPTIKSRYIALADRIESMNTFDSVNLYINVELPASFAKDGLDLIPVGGNAASDLMDKGIDALQDKANKDVAKILKKGLVELEKTDPGLTSLANTPGAQRMARVEDALRKLDVLGGDEKLFDLIDDPVQQNELQQSAIRLLTGGLKDLKNQVVDNTQSIQQLKTSVNQVSKKVSEAQKAKVAVDEAKDKVVANTAAIAAAPTENTKAVLEQQQRVAVRDFVRATQVAAGQLDAAAGIAAELGAPEVARVANLASGAMDVAAGVAMCYINPTAILPTVLSGIKLVKGLGGKKEKDPLAEQLAQIVALQKKILDKLVEMEKTLRVNHAEVVNGLGAINNNVLISLQWLRQNVEADLKSCVHLLPPNSYIPLDDDPDRGGFLRLGASTRFSDYDTFSQFATYQDANAFIGACKAALDKNFGMLNGSIPKIWTLQNTSFVKSDSTPAGVQGNLVQRIESYKHKVVESNFVVLKTFVKQEAWYELTSPVPSITGLSKFAVPSLKPPSDLYLQKYSTHLSTPIDAVAVRRYGGWLAGTHYYFELTDGMNLPYPRNALLSQKEGQTSTVGMQLVDFGLLLTDIAIAQQSLESGHLLLPIAHAAWTRPKDEDLVCKSWPASALINLDRAKACAADGTATQQGKQFAAALRAAFFADGEAAGIVRTNRLFARNLALYAVYQEISQRKSTATAYDIALQPELSANMLNALLGPDYKFGFSAEKNEKDGLQHGWFADIMGVKVMLPTATELRAATLVYQPDLAGLIDVRSRLSKELNGLAFIKQLNGRDEKSVREFLEAGIDIL